MTEILDRVEAADTPNWHVQKYIFLGVCGVPDTAVTYRQYGERVQIQISRDIQPDRDSENTNAIPIAAIAIAAADLEDCDLRVNTLESSEPDQLPLIRAVVVGWQDLTPEDHVRLHNDRRLGQLVTDPASVHAW